ncbi:hypothetical protein A33M_1821 [Rhodovulum sp. PH10]|nr:hypothetical protein A33M_1821 [Rhodovulum sp. PH10]
MCGRVLCGHGDRPVPAGSRTACWRDHPGAMVIAHDSAPGHRRLRMSLRRTVSRLD